MMMAGGGLMSFKFSEFLKHELSKKTIRANELAKLIDKVPSYVTKLQKEDIIPNYKDLRIISKAFGVNYEFLLFQIGIIDTSTLTHINAFGSLKSYLAEIMNLTDMNAEKLEVFNEFMKNNINRLNDELTDELIIETMNSLGDNFVYPNYNNPYTEDAYKGFKKIPNVSFSTVKENQSNVQSRMLPVYQDFYEDKESEPISQVPITLKVLNSKANDIANEIFWYSPTNTISNDLYLIEKVSLNNNDKILYKSKDGIFTGIYTIAGDSIIISNIYDTKKGTPIEGPPIVISSGDKSTVYIIGKIISVFKTA